MIGQGPRTVQKGARDRGSDIDQVPQDAHHRSDPAAGRNQDQRLDVRSTSKKKPPCGPLTVSDSRLPIDRADGSRLLPPDCV